jgi:hypothetical protein
MAGSKRRRHRIAGLIRWGLEHAQRPRAGRVTPLFSVRVDTSGLVYLVSLGDRRGR